MNQQDTIPRPLPAWLGQLWVARATYTGDLQKIATDIIQLEDLLSSDRKAVEEQLERAAAGADFRDLSHWCIIGLYHTFEEALAALDWVVAWRKGS